MEIRTNPDLCYVWISIHFFVNFLRFQISLFCRLVPSPSRYAIRQWNLCPSLFLVNCLVSTSCKTTYNVLRIFLSTHVSPCIPPVYPLYTPCIPLVYPLYTPCIPLYTPCIPPDYPSIPPVYPCIPLLTQVYPGKHMYTFVYLSISPYTLVYPCIPLYIPDNPSIPVLVYLCIPFYTTLYPCTLHTFTYFILFGVLYIVHRHYSK